MRSYGKNTTFYTKPRTSKRDYAQRCDVEWDIRVDISEQLTIKDVCDNIRAALEDIQYVLVSGLEKPDKEETFTNASKGEHVHIALVTVTPMRRVTALKLVRGPHKIGDEYCAPRNRKFSYAGWILHHTKQDWKVDAASQIAMEDGTCPMDPFNVEWAVKIVQMEKKFGSPKINPRYKLYDELVSRTHIQEKIESLQMLINDTDVQV